MHSSSEARYHESKIILMPPCRCTITKAIIRPCARYPSPVNYDVTCQTIHGSITKWNLKIWHRSVFHNWLQHHCGKKMTIESTWAIWSKPLFTPCVALDQVYNDDYIFHGTPPLHYVQSHYYGFEKLIKSLSSIDIIVNLDAECIIVVRKRP